MLTGPERNAVVAYWTARGLARERQAEHARWRAAGYPSDAVALRPLDRREADLWACKDAACQSLVGPVLEALERPADAELVRALIREWAGIVEPGQRGRMVACFERHARTLRKLKGGRRERGQPGVQTLLDDFHSQALDRLAQHLGDEDRISN